MLKERGQIIRTWALAAMMLVLLKQQFYAQSTSCFSSSLSSCCSGVSAVISPVITGVGNQVTVSFQPILNSNIAGGGCRFFGNEHITYDYGDGSFSPVLTAPYQFLHTYTLSNACVTNTFEVKLCIQGNSTAAGGGSFNCVIPYTITVPPQNPVYSITALQTGCKSFSFTYNGPTLNNVQWSFGNALQSPLITNGSHTVTHTYGAGGGYVVSLSADGFSACPLSFTNVIATDIGPVTFSQSVANVCDPTQGIQLGITNYTNANSYYFLINGFYTPVTQSVSTYFNNLTVVTNTIILVASNAGCSSQQSKVISIGTATQALGFNSTTLCAGSFLSVYGVQPGADVYQWNIIKPGYIAEAPIFGMNPYYMFATPGVYTINLTTSNTYTVNDVPVVCTANTPIQEFSVHAVPNPTFGFVPLSCNGSLTLALPSSSFTAYSLNFGNNTINSGNANSIPNNQLTTTYTNNAVYTVSLTLNNSGCASTYTNNFYVSGLPSLVIACDKPWICPGGSTNMSSILSNIPPASGIITYNWAGPNGFTANTPNINVFASGDYTLTVTGGIACPFTYSLTQTVIDLAQPTATLVSITPLACTSLTTSAVVQISALLQQQGFYVNGILTPANNAAVNPINITVDDLQEGLNYITVKNAIDQTCFGGISVNIIRNNPPLTVNVSDPTGCANTDFGSATAVAGPPGGVISWYTPIGYSNSTFFATGANSGNLTPGTYIAEVINGYCKTTNYFSVTPPSINLSKSGPLGTCPNMSVNITANAVFIPNTINSAFTYNWYHIVGNIANPVGGNSNVLNTGSGNYSLNVTAANSCSTTLSFEVLAYSPVSIQFNTSIPSCNNPNGYVQANVSGGDGNYTYLWYENAVLSTSVTSHTYDLSNLTIPLTLSLTVNDGSNCTASSPTPALSFGPSTNVMLLNCGGVGNTNATNITVCGISECVQGGTSPYTFEWYKVGNKSTVVEYNFYFAGTNFIADNGTQTFVITPPANPLALANAITQLNKTDSLANTIMYPVWNFTCGTCSPAKPVLNSLGTSILGNSLTPSTDFAHYMSVNESIKLLNVEDIVAAYSGPSGQVYDNSNFSDGIYKLYVTDANGCRYPFNIGQLTFPVPSTFPVSFDFVWGMNRQPVTPAEFDNNISDDMAEAAGEIAEELGACLQKQTSSLNSALQSNCSSLTQLNDDLKLEFDVTEHHYTLYYYDRAGQLTKTVPPQGVSLLSVADINMIKAKRDNPNAAGTPMVNPHTMVTSYNYNSFGQLLSQNTPDGGNTSFIYDSKNRLRFSQNAKQSAASPQVYSYTKYDELGRIIEVGESSTTSTLNFATPSIAGNVAVADLTVFPTTNRRQITTTVYSQTSAVTYYGKAQRFTQNRVSFSSIDEDPSVTGDEHFTYYSYDSHGNVEWLVQDNPGGVGRNYMSYEYDLVSGKVLQVTYNEMRQDRFYHRYQYDAENRLVNVQTSRDGLMWDNDANYKYYPHGPLKRSVTGEDHVQGQDYIYTIQGWLKSINSPSLAYQTDPGGDNTPNLLLGPGVTPQMCVANDRNGMVLNYFAGDYRSNTNNFLMQEYNTYGLASFSTSSAPSLYNGNISSWSQSQLNTISTTPILPRADLYKYDLLNRIKQSTSLEYDVNNISGWSAINANADTYKTTYDYDANGNIMNLKRYDELGVKMDELEYTYVNSTAGMPATTTNRLGNVSDLEITNVLAGRGDLEANHAYSYDAIGNLTSEQGFERINLGAGVQQYAVNTNIEWTVYGKIKKVEKFSDPSNLNRKETIKFAYDASGNRVTKEYWKDAGIFDGLVDPQEVTTTWYVRDAQGNVMGIYKKFFDITDNLYKIQLEEEAIYGSDRLGQNTHKITLQSTPNSQAITTPTNGIAVTSEYQNWITATNKTGSITPSGMGDLCQCKVVGMSNPIISGAYNNTTTAADFLGIANNGVAVAENLSGSLQFYVVLAKKYLGVNDVCLVYDKNGKLMKGSESIGQVDVKSKPVVINLPGSNQYAIVTLDNNQQVKYHVVDMNLIGYANVGVAGEVTQSNINLPVSTGPNTKYGCHFTGLENHMEQKAILYASRYTPNISNTVTGVTDIVAYEFTANNTNPTEFVINSINGCGSTEVGQLQLSPAGNKLAWYQHDRTISGFKMREGYIYTMPLNSSKLALGGTVDVHPISTAGNYGNGALEFMANNEDILYSQYGAYKQNSNAGTKFDRNIWKYSPLNLNDITINPNLVNNNPLVTYLLGEIKRGNDGKYYIPNLADPSNEIHNYDGSLWGNGINTAAQSYSYAASWPTQVWKLYADPAQTLSEYPRYVGDKTYELKDHLGNVHVVVSDAKLLTDVNTNDLVDNADSFDPEVINYNDYYAFGSQLPGRKYSAGQDYRYGFNGREKTNEISGYGVSYDYGFRIYDARIAKFVSIDPLSIDYPWYTPYQFSGNKPIWAIDLDGLEESFATDHWDEDKQEWRRTITLNDKRTKDDKGTIQFLYSDGTKSKVVKNTKYQAVVDKMIASYLDQSTNPEVIVKHDVKLPGPTSAIKKVEHKEIKPIKTVSEEKVGDKTETKIDESVKPEAKRKEVVSSTNAPCSRALRGKICGSEKEHWESSIAKFTNMLIEAGSNSILVLTWDGDGEGLVTDATSWAEEGSDGGTLADDALRLHYKVRDAIVEKSKGKVKKEQILFKFGDPNEQGVKATLMK